MSRPTFVEACARYGHRFTQDHVPAWSRQPFADGTFPAPQFRSDREWYELTIFPRRTGLSVRQARNVLLHRFADVAAWRSFARIVPHWSLK